MLDSDKKVTGLGSDGKASRGGQRGPGRIVVHHFDGMAWESEHLRPPNPE